MMTAEATTSSSTGTSFHSSVGTCSETEPRTPSPSDYEYSHDETATVRLYSSASTPIAQSAGAPSTSLNARVYLESTSTLRSTAPLFNLPEDVANTGTPFSKQVLELISKYPMQRLLIRVGDSASSSSSESLSGGKDNHGSNKDPDTQQAHQLERARGPSGTSVLASFFHDPKRTNESSQDSLKEKYQNQYASLLRYLLSRNLFPPCGAPLDSVRVGKHGHSIIVHSPRGTKNQGIVNVESVLAADAATFCPLGIHSLLLSKGDNNVEEGWGSATNNGACHSSDNWGLFDSLFAPIPLAEKSTKNAHIHQSSLGRALSQLLLGTSKDAAQWNSAHDKSGRNKRNSVWIDLEASPSCFAGSGVSDNGECTITVTRGVTYRVALQPGLIVSNDGSEPNSVDRGGEGGSFFHLSLADLLVGNDVLDRALNEKGWKAWYPCPLSDSSRVILYLPQGSKVEIEEDSNSMSDAGGISASESDRKMEINMLGRKDGYVDLAAPFAKIYNTGWKDYDSEQFSSYGISRTVLRTLGTSSGGTMLTVLRYNKSTASQHQLVQVQSFDVIPGTLLKPRMHTLRMMLYQGNGAGGVQFSPPIGEESCKHTSANTTTYIHDGSLHCRSIGLSDLSNHKLILHTDGSILLERTIDLAPDSSLWMMVDYDETYLPFQKFPADANRGVDVFPSRATFTPVENLSKPRLPTAGTCSTTLYSSPLLILPPVPDMSMPFNVISLSCTVWAFVVGSLLNMMVRRGPESVKREFTGEKEKRPIDKIKEKMQEKKKRLKEKIGALRTKLTGKGRQSKAAGDELIADSEKKNQ